jgi:hypothetical protein
MLDDIETLANHVNDTDLEWWPFLFLRPERHEPMTSARVLLLASLYGILVGVVVNVVLRLAGHPDVSPFVFPVATTLLFFVIYRATFAACWNRRAARLSPHSASRRS